MDRFSKAKKNKPNVLSRILTGEEKNDSRIKGHGRTATNAPKPQNASLVHVNASMKRNAVMTKYTIESTNPNFETLISILSIQRVHFTENL